MRDNNVTLVIKRLHKRSTIRSIAEPLMCQSNPMANIDPLLSILARPSDRKWKERLVAAWALGRVELNAGQKEAAVDILVKELANKRKSVTTGLWPRPSA